MSNNLQKYLAGLITITLAWFGARSFWRGVSRPSFFMGMIIVGFILFNYGPVTNVITNLYADHKQEQKEKLEREDKLRQEEKAEREALAKQKQIEISNVALKKIAEQTSAILTIKDNCIKHGFPATSCIKSANLELEKQNFSYRVPTTDPNAPDIATWMMQEAEKNKQEQVKKEKAEQVKKEKAEQVKKEKADELAAQQTNQAKQATEQQLPICGISGRFWNTEKQDYTACESKELKEVTKTQKINNNIAKLETTLNKAIAACRATGSYHGPGICYGPARIGL